jgi:hypothetical protein
MRAAQLADRLDALAQVVGELAHQHGPGIMRDTVWCPACAATVEDHDLGRRKA